MDFVSHWRGWSLFYLRTFPNLGKVLNMFAATPFLNYCMICHLKELCWNSCYHKLVRVSYSILWLVINILQRNGNKNQLSFFFSHILFLLPCSLPISCHLIPKFFHYTVPWIILPSFVPLFIPSFLHSFPPFFPSLCLTFFQCFVFLCSMLTSSPSGLSSSFSSSSSSTFSFFIVCLLSSISGPYQDMLPSCWQWSGMACNLIS